METQTIPAMTLWEPHASLVAWEEKKIETRGRNWNYRGPLAIHSAKKWDKTIWALCQVPAIDAAIRRHMRDENDMYSFGCVLCIVNLVDVVPMRKFPAAPASQYPFDVSIGKWTYMLTDKEREFGVYDEGRFAFIMEMVEVLKQPIPATGHQGFGWPWKREINA